MGSLAIGRTGRVGRLRGRRRGRSLEWVTTRRPSLGRKRTNKRGGEKGNGGKYTVERVGRAGRVGGRRRVQGRTGQRRRKIDFL